MSSGLNDSSIRARLARDVHEAMKEVERAEREEEEAKERVKREGLSGILELKLKRCELFKRTCYRELEEAERKYNLVKLAAN